MLFRSAFTRQLKQMYGAVNVDQARKEFEQFKMDWKDYPGAVAVWESNFIHVERLYNYGSAVRKIMYTTNAIESLNSSYRRLNRQRSVFPSAQALLKALYLATFEATKKWTMTIRNWGKVRGELSIMYPDRLIP